MARKRVLEYFLEKSVLYFVCISVSSSKVSTARL